MFRKLWKKLNSTYYIETFIVWVKNRIKLKH